VGMVLKFLCAPHAIHKNFFSQEKYKRWFEREGRNWDEEKEKVRSLIRNCDDCFALNKKYQELGN